MTDSTAQPSSAAAASSAASQAPASSAASQAPASSAASSAPASSMAASSAASSSATDTKYELKIPASLKLADAAIVERTEAIARSQGLSNDAAQKLLDAVVAEVGAQDKARVSAWEPGGAAWKERDGQWRAEALKDPVIGGSEEKLATNVELAQKVLRKFGGEDTVEFLKTTGLGSHPAALRLFAKIGAAMSESTLILGDHTPKPEAKTQARRMYAEDGGPKTKTS